MSVKASSWAWEQLDITQAEKMVLLYLADKAGDNGISWHSRARIAEHCLYKDPKSIQKIISNLEKKGLVKRFQRFTKNGDQSSNYVVVLFSGRDSSDDNHFLDKDYLASETPANKGGSVQTPPTNTVNKGGSVQTPGGGYTDPTGGSDNPPKRNRTVSESSSESVNPVEDEKNFSDRVIAELSADGLDTLPPETVRYAKMKISEFQERFPHSGSVADCWSYVVRALDHRACLSGQ